MYLGSMAWKKEVSSAVTGWNPASLAGRQFWTVHTIMRPQLIMYELHESVKVMPNECRRRIRLGASDGKVPFWTRRNCEDLGL